MRVSVVGSAGSGKTTFGRALASRHGVPFVELDPIFHQKGGVRIDPDEFLLRVGEIVAGEAWVIDGNYVAVRSLLVERATTVVWLDYTRPLVMWRVIRRSIGRTLTHNHRDFKKWRDKYHPIRWSWSQFYRVRAENEARFETPPYKRLEVMRFRSRREARQWLNTVRRYEPDGRAGRIR